MRSDGWFSHAQSHIEDDNDNDIHDVNGDINNDGISGNDDDDEGDDDDDDDDDDNDEMMIK